MLLYAVRRKYSEGFTLVEMLAAIIIVGILAAIAAPNLLGMFNNTRVKDGIGQIEGAVKEAQKLAVRRGRTCIISLSSRVVDGEQYAIADVAPSDTTIGGNDIDSNGCLLNLRELEREVILEFDDGATVEEIDSGDPVYILFTGKGNTTNDANIDGVINGANGIILVSHPNVNQKKCLQISGTLGNILTGDYVDSDGDGDLDCDPDITD